MNCCWRHRFFFYSWRFLWCPVHNSATTKRYPVPACCWKSNHSGWKQVCSATIRGDSSGQVICNLWMCCYPKKKKPLFKLHKNQISIARVLIRYSKIVPGLTQPTSTLLLSSIHRCILYQRHVGKLLFYTYTLSQKMLQTVWKRFFSQTDMDDWINQIETVGFR